jgi:CBS-domain-containing membrane protein
MRDLDVAALPICGEDQRLKGMLTDRDIVVKCIAEGKDLSSLRCALNSAVRHSIAAQRLRPNYAAALFA